jgi:hypothetical protein
MMQFDFVCPSCGVFPENTSGERDLTLPRDDFPRLTIPEVQRMGYRRAPELGVRCHRSALLGLLVFAAEACQQREPASPKEVSPAKTVQWEYARLQVGGRYLSVALPDTVLNELEDSVAFSRRFAIRATHQGQRAYQMFNALGREGWEYTGCSAQTESFSLCDFKRPKR